MHIKAYIERKKFVKMLKGMETAVEGQKPRTQGRQKIILGTLILTNGAIPGSSGAETLAAVHGAGPAASSYPASHLPLFLLNAIT